MFRDDVSTPWGPAIDFRRTEVRRFFTENALYWLIEYRFDGLRFDAVHAITEADWLDEMAAEVRRTVEARAAKSISFSKTTTTPPPSRRRFRRAMERRRPSRAARAADRRIRRLLSGLRRRSGGASGALPQGRLRLSGRAFAAPRRQTARHTERRTAADGLRSVSAKSRPDRQPRFRRAADELGRSESARSRHRAAAPLPANPAAVHGRGRQPAPRRFCSSPITMPTRAKAVREGRRREFASFPQFSDQKLLAKLPDPNAVATFETVAAVSRCSQLATAALSFTGGCSTSAAAKSFRGSTARAPSPPVRSVPPPSPRRGVWPMRAC